MEKPIENPLFGPPPKEVRLPNAPLVRVICQVQFPTILAVRKAEAESVISFQEAIRRNYPFFQKDTVSNVTLRPQGELQTETDVVWRFSDVTKKWRVSLSSSFVSLETERYDSREAFLERVATIFRAVEETLGPQVATRLGLRYVNRLQGVAFSEVERMVRREVLGLVATPFAPRVQRMLSEARLDAEEARLAIRWGKMPAKQPPAGLPLDAIETESWIIDVDVYDDSPDQSFEAAALSETVRSYAERVYSVFRWMVTEDLLRHYGGKP